MQKRTFPKAFLAQSRDVDTGSCHRASDALRRYKSGTGLTSGITSAAPGIILVIAALSLIHCQTFGGNDYEQEDCCALSRKLAETTLYCQSLAALSGMH